MKENIQTINWGIIGCGDVCEVKSGPAFNKVPDSKLVAVMRRNYEKAKDYTTRHNVPKFYTNAEDLINDEAINAIYVATPPSTHELYSAMALKARKPVYVEKPVSLNAASVERMIALEKECKGKVSVAHYRRALPLFLKIKALIEVNAIGKPKEIFLKTLQPASSKIIAASEENWRLNPAISGGGLFHDLSPHQLDILYWIFGAPFNIEARSVGLIQASKVPEFTQINFEFPGHVNFNGIWNFNAAESDSEETCSIIGENGVLRFSFFRSNNIELVNEKGSQVFTETSPEHIQQPHIANVVQYFLGKKENPCSLEEALVTMKIMDKSNN